LPKLLIEDRVNNRISQNLDLSLLESLCETTEIYPDKLIIQHAKKVGEEDKFFYLRRNIHIVILDKPYAKKLSDWCLVHEHRHLQQMAIPSLNKELRSLVKARRNSVHKQAFSGSNNDFDFYRLEKEDGIEWERVYRLIDWNRLICEADACLFASQYCGYLRPAKEFNMRFK
jgi:hypothetical protein